MSLISRCAGALILSWLAAALAPAAAHEGHEHAQEAATAAQAEVAPQAPRLALSTPRIELVAVRERSGLLIYIDDYESNAPLSGLQVELRSGARSLRAAQAGEGLYRIGAGLLDAGETLPLRILVRGDGWQEQLDGVVPRASEESVAVPQRRQWRWAAGVAAAAGLLLFWWRRQSHRRTAAP